MTIATNIFCISIIITFIQTKDSFTDDHTRRLTMSIFYIALTFVIFSIAQLFIVSNSIKNAYKLFINRNIDLEKTEVICVKT